MARTLASVAQAVDGELVGPDARFGAVSTDTRTMSRGALFVALRGERFDGNDYLSQAADRGAVGALVSRAGRAPLSQITVADTRAAFGTMARAWRRGFSLPTIAVTGSSGKTTVKQLIAGILSRKGPVCVTEGNLNNDIGVPITLMRIAAEHEFAVIELGANHPGEIDYLASLAAPTVGLITNAGPAHLEGFGSLEGVARAKGELLDRLAGDAVAVLNADDTFFADWRSRARRASIVTFGFSGTAECTVIGAPVSGEDGSRFEMRLPGGETVDIALPLLGPHNVRNALAAAAAAGAAGATAEEIAGGLAGARPVQGRLGRIEGRRGARIIDDSYNANPASARAALDLLAALGGVRVFVFGDMGELGENAEALHAEIGAYARDRCDAFVCIGGLASVAAEAYGQGAVTVDDIAAADAAVDALLGPETTVLVKASRLMRLDRLVERLTEPQPRAPRPGEPEC